MSWLYTLLLAFVFACIVLLPAESSETESTIVGPASAAVIVVSEKATPPELLAASELAKYVKLFNGVELDIRKTSNAPARSIVLSVHNPSGNKESSTSDDKYSIEIKDSKLLLIGASGRSMLYAVYDLLERMDCRWLAPAFGHYHGENEYVPRKRDVVIRLDDRIVEKPVFKFRKLYVEEGLSHTHENLIQMIDWMSKSRFNTLVVPIDYQGHGRVKWDNWRKVLIPELERRGIMIEVGGHGYQNFLNAEMESGKVYQDHPEWFGMDSEGKRRKDRSYVFCTSNPDAVAYLCKNVISYLQSHPEIDIFDFWPPDGAKWCSCPKCEELGSPADRQSKLLLQVSEEAHKQGIRSRFECIAYSVYIDPPESPAMDSSVLVDFCPIGQCFEVQIYDPSSRSNYSYVQHLKDWRQSFNGEISIYSYYRKYAWRSLPVIIPHYMQKDLRWYKNLGTAGISSYAEPGDWQTYEMNHYALSKLAWNPDADVDKIISDFCIGRYEDKAGKAAAVYNALEDTVRRVCSIPGTSLKSPKEVEGCINRLEAVSKALSESKSDTFSLLLAVEYAIRDMKIRLNEALNGSPEEREKMVREMVEFLNVHGDEGVFISHDRIDYKRLAGVYNLEKPSK